MNPALTKRGELHYSPLEIPMLKVPAVNGGIFIIKSQSYYRRVTLIRAPAGARYALLALLVTPCCLSRRLSHNRHHTVTE
jgi:hypothetical protein